MKPPNVIPFQPRDHIRRVPGHIPRISGSIDPCGQAAVMLLMAAVTEARIALQDGATGAADEFLIRAQAMLRRMLEAYDPPPSPSPAPTPSPPPAPTPTPTPPKDEPS